MRQIIGWALLVTGVAGLFLPVLQGWLFIGIGALLLAPHVRRFHRLAAWIHLRFPVLRKGLRKFRHFHSSSRPPD